MDDLTAADLFSPSKARQQRAQAQDWAQIDSWLAAKYAPRGPPAFERNEETLKVLRELATANERADEERDVRWRLEREALREVDETETNPQDAEILDAIKGGLGKEGNTALHALASTATTLSTPTTDAQSLAHALIQHTITTQNLSDQLSHIQTLHAYLQKEHSLLRNQLADLATNEGFRVPSAMHRQTTDQVRQTKQLKSKIREHEDKLSSLQSSLGKSSVGRGSDVSSAEAIEAMLERAEALDGLRRQVEELEGRVDEYRGLPADRDAARREVGRLEVELDAVRRRRDEMFGGLVGG